MLRSEKFLSGSVDTSLIDENPQLFQFAPSQNRAQKLLHYLANVMVNGSLTPLATTLKPSKVTPALPPITAGRADVTYTIRLKHRETSMDSTVQGNIGVIIIIFAD